MQAYTSSIKVPRMFRDPLYRLCIVVLTGNVSTRTQTNSYPDQLVPRPTRTQTNWYPAHLIPRPTRTQTIKAVAFVSGDDSDDTLERNLCMYTSTCKKGGRNTFLKINLFSYMAKLYFLTYTKIMKVIKTREYNSSQ